MTQVTQGPAKTRAQIQAKTLRTDPWYRSPRVTATGLTIIVLYLLFASFANTDYIFGSYISPLYSPCLATTCTPSDSSFFLVPWLTWLTPAIIIIGGPLGFRFTCYYYRKAYYRAFWRSPAACAVAEPHARYRGESRLPLIIQNVHRYFFWIAIAFNIFLTYDAVVAFKNPYTGAWGHFGVGTLMLVVNAILLWIYSVSCHACRHITGGRLKHFSKHPVRYKAWTVVSRLNNYHMQFAWVSLTWVTLTDLYIRLAAAGVFGHGSWI